ncbi:MAG: HlyD family efflux transporter periplasmic adaptor subunit [Bryobacteraceae bacterium]
MAKRIIPILLLLAVAGGAYWYWRSIKEAEANGHIRISGNIEMTQIDISFKVPGKLIELAVKEGDAVKKGQLIARIDRGQMDRQKERDQATVDMAENGLTTLNTSIQYQKATIDGDIELKKAQVAQADARLRELQAGSRSQEINQAQSAVANARTQAENAKLDWDRAQKLYKNEDISTSQFDQARTRFQSTQALLQQAEQQLALVKEGPRKEEIAMARAQVEQARASVKLAEANRLDLKRREQEIGARRAEIERNKAQLAMTQTQINDTEVYSPVDGVVLVKSAEQGEIVAAGATVVTIGDVEHPWLRAYINERDLDRVKLGAKVRLSSDSRSGKEYEGRISFIASEAEFTPKQIQTNEERVKLVYRIKVDVANPNHELKSNMPVDGEIQL